MDLKKEEKVQGKAIELGEILLERNYPEPVPNFMQILKRMIETRLDDLGVSDDKKCINPKTGSPFWHQWVNNAWCNVWRNDPAFKNGKFKVDKIGRDIYIAREIFLDVDFSSDYDERYFEGERKRGKGCNLPTRNVSWASAVKKRNKQNNGGVLTCELCSKVDSDLGGYISNKTLMTVHHIDQLKNSPKEGRYLTVDDGCVLCPNCHGLTEYYNEPRLKELKRKIKYEKRSNDRRNKIYRIEEKAIKTHNGRDSILRRRRKCV